MGSDCPVFFMLYKALIRPAHRLRAEDTTLTISFIVIRFQIDNPWIFLKNADNLESISITKTRGSEKHALGLYAG